jgi:hypothetical protein
MITRGDFKDVTPLKATTLIATGGAPAQHSSAALSSPGRSTSRKLSFARLPFANASLMKLPENIDDNGTPSRSPFCQNSIDDSRMCANSRFREICGTPTRRDARSGSPMLRANRRRCASQPRANRGWFASSFADPSWLDRSGPEHWFCLIDVLQPVLKNDLQIH